MDKRFLYRLGLLLLTGGLLAVAVWRSSYRVDLATIQQRRLTGGDCYLRSYVPVATPYGVVTIAPGTRVHRTTPLADGRWNATDGRYDFAVSAVQVTGDVTLGETLHVHNENTPRALIEERRRFQVDRLAQTAAAQKSLRDRLAAARTEAVAAMPASQHAVSASMNKSVRLQNPNAFVESDRF